MAASQLLSTGVLYTDRRIFYPTPQEFAELYPAATPFLSGLFAMGPQTGTERDYKMFESRAPWRHQYFQQNDGTPTTWAVAGAPADTANNITIDGATGITVDASLVGSVVEIWNEAQDTLKGYARISGVDSTTQLDIVSLGYPLQSAFQCSALADNDYFFVLGNAKEEVATAGEAASHELEVVYNSLQRMTTPLEISEDLRDVALRGQSDELARQRKAKSNEHKTKLERTLFRGMRTSGIGGVAHGAGAGTDSTFLNHISGETNSTQVRTTMGAIPIMLRYGRTSGDQQNNFSPVKATYTLSQFTADVEKAFVYNPTGGEKVMYAGPSAVSFLSGVDFAAGSGFELNHNVKSDSLGIVTSRLTTPHGNMRVVKAPLLDGPWKNYAVVVDPENVGLAQGHPDQYKSNVKTDDDYTAQKDLFKSQFGLKLTLTESHSIWNFQ